MAWVLLETEAALSLGPQCPVWGLAQRTWLLTGRSGPWVRRSPRGGEGQGPRAEWQQGGEHGLGLQLGLGTRLASRERRVQAGVGTSGAEIDTGVGPGPV